MSEQRAAPAPDAGALRHSPLEARHEALGASLVPFAGWRMPLRYGSELAEHHAVRRAAGLFDLSHMGEIAVRGGDAGALLDTALVGWLSALEIGQARYTMACAPSGGILDDLVVYRRGEDDFLVVANAANTAVVLEALSSHAGERARVEDETDAVGLVALQGPRAAAILERLVGQPLTELGNYRARPLAVLGAPALVARTGYTGEDGFELFLPAAAAGAVFDALVEAGVQPAGLAARDSLRLEAGMPLYGNELSTSIDPYAAGLGRVVRLDKPGDFVGRAALERAAAAPPPRRLVGLLGSGRRAARGGYAVVTAGEEHREVGTVTSGAPSPTLERPVAMAYVESAWAEPGGALAVDVRGRLEAVTVTRLPFYRRPRPSAAPTPGEDA